MALLVPALLKSMDLQCGQRVAVSPTVARIISQLPPSPAPLARRTGAIGGRRGVKGARVRLPAGHGAAPFPRRRQLFRRSQVRLRQPDTFPGARNLAFVPLEQSLGHSCPFPGAVQKCLIRPSPPKSRRPWPRWSASERRWKRHSAEPCELPWSGSITPAFTRSSYCFRGSVEAEVRIRVGS